MRTHVLRAITLLTILVFVAACAQPTAAPTEVPTQAPTEAPTEAPAEPPKPAIAPIKPEIGLEDFAKVDLRAGTVVLAEKIPNAKKLLLLKVDLGEGRLRTVVAGIAAAYEPRDVVGRQVIVVANLKPAKLRGIESNGMLLATAADGENFALLTVSKDVEQGIGIK